MTSEKELVNSSYKQLQLYYAIKYPQSLCTVSFMYTLALSNIPYTCTVPGAPLRRAYPDHTFSPLFRSHKLNSRMHIATEPGPYACTSMPSISVPHMHTNTQKFLKFILYHIRYSVLSEGHSADGDLITTRKWGS
jgi:hypothetical protein